MIRNILLCGDEFLFPRDFLIDAKQALFHYHFYMNKGCDRKERIEFKRLMIKWRQKPLPKDYWENQEDE